MYKDIWQDSGKSMPVVWPDDDDDDDDDIYVYIYIDRLIDIDTYKCNDNFII